MLASFQLRTQDLAVSGALYLTDQKITAEAQSVEHESNAEQPFRQPHDIVETDCQSNSDGGDRQSVPHGNKPKVFEETDGAGKQADDK